jgi:hypothetical protein
VRDSSATNAPICEGRVNLIWGHSLTGDDRAALELAHEALRIAESEADPELIARVWGAQAFALEGVGDAATCVRALEFFTAAGDLEEVVCTEGHLANLALQRGELGVARAHLEAALPILEDVGGGPNAVVPTLNLALVEFLKGGLLASAQPFHLLARRSSLTPESRRAAASDSLMSTPRSHISGARRSSVRIAQSAELTVMASVKAAVTTASAGRRFSVSPIHFRFLTFATAT